MVFSFYSHLWLPPPPLWALSWSRVPALPETFLRRAEGRSFIDVSPHPIQWSSFCQLEGKLLGRSLEEAAGSQSLLGCTGKTTGARVREVQQGRMAGCRINQDRATARSGIGELQQGAIYVLGKGSRPRESVYPRPWPASWRNCQSVGPGSSSVPGTRGPPRASGSPSSTRTPESNRQQPSQVLLPEPRATHRAGA